MLLGFYCQGPSDLNCPRFARHLSASQNGDQGGVNEQQTISRRVQDWGGPSGYGSRL